MKGWWGCWTRCESKIIAPPPTIAEKPTAPNRVPVSLRTSLVKDAPPETLLTGPDAVALIGATTHADTILQPNDGEFIATHRAYLIRNPYFACHESFTVHQNESVETPFKPHPTEFRLLLQCIYANTPEYCRECIVKQNFLPLLLNAQFFVEENVLVACASWFHANWRDAVLLNEFNYQSVDNDTLSSLLSELNAETEAATTLHVIFPWARNWGEEDGCKPLREFVESHVDFKCVRVKEWIELVTAHERSVEFCIVPKTHLHFVNHAYAAVKIYCELS
ncbi:hypothetical protein HDU98_007511 [Podochytrium sp. JEL0797]|nr:hypothetical protein HDU98_007511 [Podochytrium sp. JEL0797]